MKPHYFDQNVEKDISLQMAMGQDKDPCTGCKCSLCHVTGEV